MRWPRVGRIQVMKISRVDSHSKFGARIDKASAFKPSSFNSTHAVDVQGTCGTFHSRLYEYVYAQDPEYSGGSPKLI